MTRRAYLAQLLRLIRWGGAASLKIKIKRQLGDVWPQFYSVCENLASSFGTLRIEFFIVCKFCIVVLHFDLQIILFKNEGVSACLGSACCGGPRSWVPGVTHPGDSRQKTYNHHGDSRPKTFIRPVLRPERKATQENQETRHLPACAYGTDESGSGNRSGGRVSHVNRKSH